MTNQQMLDDRYGRTTSGRRRAGIIVAAALGAVAALLLGWMVVTSAMDDVDSDATGFEVVDEHSVTLDFQVTVPPGRAVACALEAQDEDFGVVGWKVVEFEAAERPSSAYQAVIPTTALATTGFVNSCWVT